MELSDEAILKAMDRFAAIREQGTLPNLLAFARVLKTAGLKVGLSQIIDASHSLEFVNVGSREDFRAVLRSNLISEKEEIATFDHIFDCFWQNRSPQGSPMESTAAPEVSAEDETGESGDGEGSLEEVIARLSDQEAEKEEEPFSVPTYSPIEARNRKDFSEMGMEESRAMSQAILLIARKT